MGRVVSNRQGWQHQIFPETFEPNTNQWFFQLVDEIKCSVEKVYSELKPRTQHEMSLQIWANINWKNDYNNTHHHMGGFSENPVDNYGTVIPFLSGVYYLKKPENSGDLIFNTQAKYLKRYFYHDFDSRVSAKEGEMLLFYPHVEHSVEANHSDEERISFAFNVILFDKRFVEDMSDGINA